MGCGQPGCFGILETNELRLFIDSRKCLSIRFPRFVGIGIGKGQQEPVQMTGRTNDVEVVVIPK